MLRAGKCFSFRLQLRLTLLSSAAAQRATLATRKVTYRALHAGRALSPLTMVLPGALAVPETLRASTPAPHAAARLVSGLLTTILSQPTAPVSSVRQPTLHSALGGVPARQVMRITGARVAPPISTLSTIDASIARQLKKPAWFTR